MEKEKYFILGIVILMFLLVLVNQKLLVNISMSFLR